MKLRKIIILTATIHLVASCSLIPLSFCIAAASPFGIHQPGEVVFFQQVSAVVHIPETPAVHACIAGSSIFADRWVRALVYLLPLLLVTGSFLYLTHSLHRLNSSIDCSALNLLYKLPFGFAAVSVFIYPIFTQDLWIYIVWGKMLAGGENPYYNFFSSQALAGTPLPYFPIHMTYGPLWSLVSGALGWVGRNDALVEYFLYKLLLFSFWSLSFIVIHKILDKRSLLTHALGLTFFGWLPLSFYSSIAEGHNDIVMVFFLLLWLYLLAHDQYLQAPFSLAVSILFKYVTAPLIVLDQIFVWTRHRAGAYKYEAIWLAAALISALAFVPFCRDLSCFSSTLEMQQIDFFTPTHAIASLFFRMGISLPTRVVRLLHWMAALGIGLFYLVRYLKSRQFAEFVELVIVTIIGLLFAILQHIWPWYLIWMSAPAALITRSRLMHFVLPVAVLGPFLNLYWLLGPTGWQDADYGSILFYLGVLPLMMISLRSKWLAGAME